MKYPLDCELHCEQSFLFWLTRFIRYKITTLSNRHVNNKERLAQILKIFSTSIPHIKELDEYIKEVRNLGIVSIHVYFIPLAKLYEYLQNFGAASLKEIDEELLSDFLTSQTANLSDASKKNYRIALTSFFGYLDKNNEEDKISHHFDILLKNWGGLRGKSGTKLPAFMQEHEVQRFLKAIEEFNFKEKIGARNRLIIKIIIYTGIRISEALNLTIKDIIFDGDFCILQVRGKGNKPRVVMLKKTHIINDFELCKACYLCENGLLFCNQNSKALTQAYVSRQVELILASCGIRKEKNGAHMLRHTFATMLYQKSKDLILVQESLGHSDINTSRIYTHFDKSRLIQTTDIFS